MTRRALIIVLSIAALAFLAGIWTGCTVSFDANQEDLFFCESDEDCIEPAFICNTAENVCERPGVGPSLECVDEDEDGYGVGPNRSGCQFPQEDCDDTNPDINPGASEICDGIDNNCDDNVDIIPCESNSDCPGSGSDPEGNDITYSCDDIGGQKLCVARPVKQICPGVDGGCPECRNVLQCTDGSLDVVPEQCR